MRLDLLVQSCATDAYRLLQRCLHECFECRELVHDTHRLALMNAMLHDIEGQIILGDTLSNIGKSMNGYHLVLPNPPFGSKKGGERATRDDFTYPTSNK